MVMDTFDENNSGRISVVEFASFVGNHTEDLLQTVAQVIWRNQSGLRVLFAYLDQDKSGDLDMQQFLKVFVPPTPHDRPPGFGWGRSCDDEDLRCRCQTRRPGRGAVLERQWGVTMWVVEPAARWWPPCHMSALGHGDASNGGLRFSATTVQSLMQTADAALISSCL